MLCAIYAWRSCLIVGRSLAVLIKKMSIFSIKCAGSIKYAGDTRWTNEQMDLVIYLSIYLCIFI